MSWIVRRNKPSVARKQKRLYSRDDPPQLKGTSSSQLTCKKGRYTSRIVFEWGNTRELRRRLSALWLVLDCDVSAVTCNYLRAASTLVFSRFHLPLCLPSPARKHIHATYNVHIWRHAYFCAGCILIKYWWSCLCNKILVHCPRFVLCIKPCGLSVDGCYDFFSLIFLKGISCICTFCCSKQDLSRRHVARMNRARDHSAWFYTGVRVLKHIKVCGASFTPVLVKHHALHSDN